MKALRLLLPILAFLGPLVAQEKQDTNASVLVELDQALPRRAFTPGQPVTAGNTIDWDKKVQALEELLARSAGMPAEPSVAFQLGNAYFNADRIDEARVIFEDLRTRFPEHPLVRVKLDPAAPKSLVDQAIDDCADELAFRKRNQVKSLPRPVLDMKELVTIHTSAGQIRFRFYENASLAHRANFTKLAKSGFYDRTRVHRLVPGVLIHLGDPLSRDDNMAEWGKGDPGYTLPPEYSLATHKKGTLSMWRAPGRPESHGSQFQIILQDQPHLDFMQTPFGEIVSGDEQVADMISRRTQNQYQGPAEEVFINGISFEAR